MALHLDVLQQRIVVAAAHRKLLLHRRFEATSPNGRFVEGAAAINNRPLRRIEVHGKNLFYFFSECEDVASGQLSHAAQQLVSSPSHAAQAIMKPETDDAVPTTPEPRPRKAAKSAAGGRRKSRAPTSPNTEHLPVIQAGAPASDEANASGSTTSNGAKAEDDSAEVPALPSPAVQKKEEEEQHDRVVVLRIHFGMSGAFRLHSSLPGPEPTATTRLTLTHRQLGLVAHLSAMTVEHGSLELYLTNVRKLGPDPLREDADKEVLWRSIQKSRKPVGLVLMSQELIAGLGNIYRAEVLFKAGVHPEQPSSSITRSQFELLWFHSVQLLQRGFVSGSILTVDPEEAKVLGKPWTRRYIYNQGTCGRCKGAVRSWEMAGRTVYCCDTCQPLIAANTSPAAEQPAAQTPEAASTKPKRGRANRQRADAVAVIALTAPASAVAVVEPVTPASKVVGELLSPARRKAMAGAGPARLFHSKCAPDEEEGVEGTKALVVPEKLTVMQLKAQLLALSMSTRGNKSELVARLHVALRAAGGEGDMTPSTVHVTAAEGHTEPCSSEDELDHAETMLAANLGVHAPAPARHGGAGVAAALGSPPVPNSGGQETAAESPRSPDTLGLPSVTPGTQGLVGHMKSAKAAALEKLMAGENRAVEHVALADDQVDALIAAHAPKRGNRKRRATTEPTSN